MLFLKNDIKVFISFISNNFLTTVISTGDSITRSTRCRLLFFLLSKDVFVIFNKGETFLGFVSKPPLLLVSPPDGIDDPSEVSREAPGAFALYFSYYQRCLRHF